MDLLQKNGIGVIINLSVEKCPNAFKDSFIYENYNIPDKPTVEIGVVMKEINEKINQYLSQEKWVIVHCYKGISRAPTIVISYLMKYQNKSLDEAFSFLKMKAPKVDPNAGFLM